MNDILQTFKSSSYYNIFEQACHRGFFGYDCSERCLDKCTGCNAITGLCDSGCIPGWKGYFCNKGTGHNIYFLYPVNLSNWLIEREYKVYGTCIYLIKNNFLFWRLVIYKWLFMSFIDANSEKQNNIK